MRTLVFLVLLIPLSSFSQRIENIRTEVQGGKTVITYDLIPERPPFSYSYSISAYFLGDSLYMPTYGATGDIGKGVKEGRNKRIVWPNIELGHNKVAVTVSIAHKRINWKTFANNRNRDNLIEYLFIALPPVIMNLRYLH